jgi:O-antigen/teichoic acid export membrane protein
MAPAAPTARSVGIDALLYVPGRAIPAVVQVLTISLLTYFFSIEEVGRYDLAFRFALFLCTATVLWLNMAVLRLYPAHQKDGTLPPFFSVLAWLRYALIALGALAGALCWGFGPEGVFGNYRDLLLPATAVFIGYSVYESGLAVLRARRMPGRYSIAATINALCRLPLAAALFYWGGFGVSGMLWALTITYLAAHAAFLWSQTGRPHFEWGTREKAIMRTILLYGLPVAGAQLLNFFLGNLDRYFLQVMRGAHEVGLYAVATNLVEQPMMLIFQTFTLAVFPSVASAWEQHGPESAEKLVRGVTRIFLVACLPAGVYLGCFSRQICEVFAHGDAVEAYRAAPWIAAASFLYGLHYLANFGLHLAHKTGLLLAATVAALAMNAGLNYVLVQQDGFVGAGMARCVANGAFVLVLVALSRRYLRWDFPWASLARAAAASGVAAALAMAVSVNASALGELADLTLTTAVFGAVLFGGLYAAGEIPRDLRRWRKG